MTEEPNGVEPAPEWRRPKAGADKEAWDRYLRWKYNDMYITLLTLMPPEMFPGHQQDESSDGDEDNG